MIYQFDDEGFFFPTGPKIFKAEEKRYSYLKMTTFTVKYTVGSFAYITRT